MGRVAPTPVIVLYKTAKTAIAEQKKNKQKTGFFKAFFPVGSSVFCAFFLLCSEVTRREDEHFGMYRYLSTGRV